MAEKNNEAAVVAVEKEKNGFFKKTGKVAGIASIAAGAGILAWVLIKRLVAKNGDDSPVDNQQD